MKAFFEQAADMSQVERGSTMASLARVAIYDDLTSAPRVEEVSLTDTREFIETISTKVYEAVRSLGGSLPYTVIREVSENFIHARFAEPVVTVMDSGNTVRFTDQGPGIPDKSRAVQPGFTSATIAMKEFIRGVGSGLPIVAEYLSLQGGSLLIEDNLGSGCVVTLSSKGKPAIHQPLSSPADSCALSGSRGEFEHQELTLGIESTSSTRLSTRQKQVLALVLESGSAGPSLVSKELRVGLSTAYRDLASLEEMGLIEADGGKRRLTDEGVTYLTSLMKSQ